MIALFAAPLRFAGTLVAALTLLAGCEMSPEMPQFPPFGFADKPPIRLDVAEIVVEQPYTPPLESPHVEHLMPVSPGDAVRRWVKDRLRAAGETGTARVTIADASAIATDLETQGGISGMFTTETATRTMARLDVSIALEQPEQTTTLRVKAERATGIPEGASLNARDQIWYDLVKTLMADFDTQFSETLRSAAGVGPQAMRQRR